MPLQSEPVLLPSTTLTIPVPHSRSHKTPSTSSSNLKIQITPHLLLPSPPFAQGASGRKIEDCVEVVVDIGGRVDVGLEVDEDGLEWAAEYDGEDVEGMIKKRVQGLFEANIANLALTGISIPSLDIDRLSSPLDDLSSSPPNLRNTLIRLSPLISNPSHSSLLKTLTTTGRPQAILTRLDIKLEWAPIKHKGISNESRAEEEEDEEEEEVTASQGSGEGEESQHAWDQDEFCDAQADDEDLEGEDGGEKEKGLPKWVEGQLKNGIHKLMRTHMIRRLPLIFDFALIQHASHLALHRSLTTSLTHFLTLSSTHSTSFLTPARHLLQSLSTNQEIYINLTVDSASSIRGIATKNPTKRAKRRKTDLEKEETDPDLQTARGRSRAYMLEVAKKLEEEDAGPRVDERRIGRLVGEAMGKVGRGKWDQGRKGIGRMAAHRVPLKDVENSHTVKVNEVQSDQIQDSALEEENINDGLYIDQDDLFLSDFSNPSDDGLLGLDDDRMVLDFDQPASLSSSNYPENQEFEMIDQDDEDENTTILIDDMNSRDDLESQDGEGGLYDGEEWVIPNGFATEDLYDDFG